MSNKPLECYVHNSESQVNPGVAVSLPIPEHCAVLHHECGSSSCIPPLHVAELHRGSGHSCHWTPPAALSRGKERDARYKYSTSGHDIVQHSLHRFRPSRRISAHVEKKISEWPVLITVLNERKENKRKKRTSTLSMFPPVLLCMYPHRNPNCLTVFRSRCITDYVFG